MFCRNCGSRLNDGALFCQNCGTRVGVPHASQPAANPSEGAALSQPEPQSNPAPVPQSAPAPVQVPALEPKPQQPIANYRPWQAVPQAAAVPGAVPQQTAPQNTAVPGFIPQQTVPQTTPVPEPQPDSKPEQTPVPEPKPQQPIANFRPWQAVPPTTVVPGVAAQQAAPQNTAVPNFTPQQTVPQTTPVAEPKPDSKPVQTPTQEPKAQQPIANYRPWQAVPQAAAVPGAMPQQVVPQTTPVPEPQPNPAPVPQSAPTPVQTPTPKPELQQPIANYRPWQAVPPTTAVPGVAAQQAVPQNTAVPGVVPNQAIPQNTAVPGVVPNQAIPQNTAVPSFTPQQVVPQNAAVPGMMPRQTTPLPQIFRFAALGFAGEAVLGTSQAGPDAAGVLRTGPGAVIGDAVKRLFSSFASLFRDPKRLIVPIALALVWLVLGILRAASPETARAFPLRSLSFLTYADGGLGGGFFGALGGILGKSVLAGGLVSLVGMIASAAKRKSGGPGAPGRSFGQTLLGAFGTDGDTVWAYLTGAGAAMFLYLFLSGGSPRAAFFAGIAACFLSARAALTNGFLKKLFASFSARSTGAAGPRAAGFLRGLSVGFAAAAGLGLINLNLVLVILGGVLFVGGAVMMILQAAGVLKTGKGVL
ncbi:MAG: zinc-ribbon domain-containing protein [Clostridia bacterium]|nr:zinc-ribbon domain-containing protein [Clostridia bacterium]